ncbi:SDR family oxidoreductase [Nocardia vinacea]|uniref:SDR family oxidoreductase n=1 Tax=Nocardia vinacea TaxID=96468 RepID=A0ABZ1YWA4_9NOCA|nr:SDR family oxidoreductase [Nocardia vinacea]
MVNELAGKVAIVTGGAAGIGAAIVELFAAEGARVVIADRDSDGGEQLAERLGADVIFTKTDVADPEQVTQMVATAVERFGGLDIMVNNAGISGAMHAGFLDDDLADFHQVLGVNLLGVMAGTREAARHMVANGGGSIINVSSIGGVQAGASVMSYRASKAAVIHFTKSAAMEFAAADIRINCIAPGNIPTSLLASAVANMSAEDAERFVGAAREIMRNTKPLRRDGEARDVAEAALYFGSDRSAYVTGTILPVDGGTVAGMKSQVKDLR